MNPDGLLTAWFREEVSPTAQEDSFVQVPTDSPPAAQVLCCDGNVHIQCR